MNKKVDENGDICIEVWSESFREFIGFEEMIPLWAYYYDPETKFVYMTIPNAPEMVKVKVEFVSAANFKKNKFYKSGKKRLKARDDYHNRFSVLLPLPPVNDILFDQTLPSMEGLLEIKKTLGIK